MIPSLNGIEISVKGATRVLLGVKGLNVTASVGRHWQGVHRRPAAGSARFEWYPMHLQGMLQIPCSALKKIRPLFSL